MFGNYNVDMEAKELNELIKFVGKLEKVI